MAQKDGCYPRVNGTMLQSLQFDGMIVSLVGKLIGPGHFQASDGTNVSLDTSQMEEIAPNPDMVIEIIGQVADSTNVTAFVCRELSTDMDLGVYDQMLSVQQSSAFSSYFPLASASVTN